MKRKKTLKNEWFARVFLSLLFLQVPIWLLAQEIKVKGTVTDVDNLPLPGVSIIIKGTSTGTITNLDGFYEINVPNENSIISISYIGYLTEEVQVGSQRQIDFQLAPDLVSLEEVVVTGYTTERKADLTGAVSIVDMDKVEELPSGNVMKNIQGRIPGVNILTDGSPGSNAVVRIRGISTLNNNDPLYVIDGVPTKSGMHELNPNDIESIQVLKDAAAASIYGSRSANGVIVITTKSAKEGKTKINFDALWSVQQYTSKLEPLNTYNRGYVYWQAAVNDRLTPVSPLYNYTWNGDFDNPILGSITTPEYIDADQTMRAADTKWFDEISRTSLLKSYNLSISKGDKKSKVLFSLGYYDHDGIVKETNFNRLNTRINSEFNLFDGLLKIGENFTLSYQREILINASDVQFNSLVQHPIIPVYTEDGGWGGPVAGMTDRQNPVRLIEDNKHNQYQFMRPFGNFFAELEPIKNLKLRTNFGFDVGIYYLRGMQKSYVSGFLTEPDNTVYNNSSYRSNWVWSNTAVYNLELNKHRADFLAGIEHIRNKDEWYNASRQGLALEDMNYAYLNSGTKNQLNSGLGSEWALESYFAKVNYSYAFKYLASFTIRRDGSSRFGANNKYAVFPAASVGWRISEEPFLKSIIDIPYQLKLRASWGQNGNQEIKDLARYNIYRTVYGKEDAIWDNPNPPDYLPNLGTAYDISGIDQGQLPSGFINTQKSNEDLKWETTTQTNFGIDFSFFEKFSGSVDYFNKLTEDILYYRLLVSAVGEASGQYVNGGSIQNKGLEFLLNYSDKIGQVSLDISGNMSFIKNEVIDMPEDMTIRMPLSGIIPNEAKTELPSTYVVGNSINSIYGYIEDGLFQSEADVTNHANQPGKAVGRIKYRDISGPDGVPDGVIDDFDQTFIAVADPDFTYGLGMRFGYKNFDLDLFLQGVYGIEVYNSYKTYTDFASLWPGTNWGARTLDAWSPQNTSSTIPKLTTIDNNNEGRLSTYFIENGSYLKLRNIQLGYTFTPKNPESSFIQSFRVYIQGQNLLTIKSKDFTGPDPENPSYAFPIPAIYSLGLKLGL